MKKATIPHIYIAVFWRRPCSLVVAFIFSFLEVEAVSSFRRFVFNYQATRWHNPEDFIRMIYQSLKYETSTSPVLCFGPLKLRRHIQLEDK
jgi:hypothetical protein